MGGNFFSANLYVSQTIDGNIAKVEKIRARKHTQRALVMSGYMKSLISQTIIYYPF